MSDRWMDDREPQDWRERQDREQRYRRDTYGAQDYSGRYAEGERSFQPRQGPPTDRNRGGVFGERQTGADYAAQRPEGGPRGNPYGYDRGGARDQEHAYRVAYGDHHPDHAGHYESRGRDDRDRNDRSFWEKAGDRVASWFGDMDYEPDGFRGRDRDGYRGDHRGRGPSGYKRSDERINEEVHDRLTADRWVDASAITVNVSSGEVTLGGKVNDRDARRRAERLVEDLSGVTHVQNNIRVEGRGNILTEPGRGFGDSASAAQSGNGRTAIGENSILSDQAAGKS